MEKYLSIHSFSVMGHTFWKENVEDRVKLLELNVLNKNELGNDVSEDLAPKFPFNVPHSTTPSTPQGHLFFALLAMNGPLPAEPKCRENTAKVANVSFTNLCK